MTHQIMNGWLSRINPQDPGLKLDADGQCMLSRDGEHCVVLVPNASGPQFYLFVDVCTLPEDAGIARYQQLLELNLLALETGGGILGFDSRTRKVVFSFSYEFDRVDVTFFCTLFGNFLDLAAGLRKRLADAADVPAAARPRRSQASIQMLGQRGSIR